MNGQWPRSSGASIEQHGAYILLAGGCYDTRMDPGSGVCREARDGACVRYAEEHVVNDGRYKASIRVVAASQCTQDTNTANCATGKCEMIGATEVCTQCATAGNVPIDGVCNPFGEATDKCQKATGNPLENTDITCGKCLNAYFMYKGGCYSKDAAPGSTMCTEAADGKCSAAATGYFVPPAADRDNTHQSTIPCGSEEETTAGNSHKYKGVANCKVCTAPENGDGADCC